MLKRAYTILQVKSFEEDGDQRIIKGIATTPAIDRMGDEVESTGAIFKTPMPLLLHHDHKLPVGTVEFAKVQKDGIPFIARIANIEKEGVLKDRTDEAWQSVKAGLIQAVSIGFSAIEYVQTKTGLKFTKWEWLELSLVTVPANSEATITAIKSLDQKFLPVGDSTKTAKTKLKLTQGIKMKKYAEQIAQLKAQIKENVEAMEALQAKALEAGEALGEDEQKEFDTLQSDTEILEKNLKNTQYLQTKSIESAVEVKGANSRQAADSRGPGQRAADRQPVRLSASKSSREDKNDNGLGFAKMIYAMGRAQGNFQKAIEIADTTFRDESICESLEMFSKAAVDPATNANLPYLGNLIEDSNVTTFLELQEEKSILWRSGLRPVPFYSKWIEELDTGEAGWVGEMGRKPVTESLTRKDVMPPFKLAAISVVSDENVRDTGGKSLTFLRDSLIRKINRKADRSFIDPTFAGIADVAPPSITYGVTPTASTGDAQDDIELIIQAVKNASGREDGNVLVMSTQRFNKLLFLRQPVSNLYVYPELATSNSLFGVTILASEFIGSFANSTGDYMFAYNINNIFLGYAPSDPGISISYSNQATVVMDDNTGGTTGGTYSLWQNNATGVLVERAINWKKARLADSVIVMNQITW